MAARADSMRKPLVRLAWAGLACVLLAACQSGGGEAAPEASGAEAETLSAVTDACAPKDVRWGAPQQRERLVGVSQLIEDAAGRKGETVPYSFVPVRPVGSAVTATVKVDETAVVTSLEKRLGLDAGALARPGKDAPVATKGTTLSIKLTGRDVKIGGAVGVTVVEAGFAFDCAASKKPVYGAVTTWRRNVSGSFACGVDPKEAYVREAQDLLCGAGARP